MSRSARELNHWAKPLRADRSGSKVRAAIAKLPPRLAAAIRCRARRALWIKHPRDERFARVLLHPTHPMYRDAAVECLAELDK